MLEREGIDMTVCNFDFLGKDVGLDGNDLYEALFVVIDCAMALDTTGYVEETTQQRAYDLLRKLDIPEYRDMFEEHEEEKKGGD